MARKKGLDLKKLLKNKMVWLLGALGVGFWLWKRSQEKLPAGLPPGMMPMPTILPGYESTVEPEVLEAMAAARGETPAAAGLENYVTSADVAGLGYDVDTGGDAFGQAYDVDSGADAFGRVSRADVAYDDTF